MIINHCVFMGTKTVEGKGGGSVSFWASEDQVDLTSPKTLRSQLTRIERCFFMIVSPRFRKNKALDNDNVLVEKILKSWDIAVYKDSSQSPITGLFWGHLTYRDEKTFWGRVRYVYSNWSSIRFCPLRPDSDL